MQRNNGTGLRLQYGPLRAVERLGMAVGCAQPAGGVAPGSRHNGPGKWAFLTDEEGRRITPTMTKITRKPAVNLRCGIICID